MDKWKLNRIKNIKEFLDDVSNFLDFFCESSFSHPLILNLDRKYVIFNQFTQSLQQTYQNIESALFNGNYSNGFTLIRQFRDDLLLYLVMILEGANENKNISISFTLDDFLNDPIAAIYEYENEIYKYDYLKEREALQKWFDDDETRDFINYNSYLNYLLNNSKIKKLHKTLDFDAKLKNANEILNGHTHSKSIKYFINNASWTLPLNKIEILNQKVKDVLLTIIEYAILVLCHIKPILLCEQCEPEFINTSQVLDYFLDCRVITIISKYSNDKIIEYMKLETEFTYLNI